MTAMYFQATLGPDSTQEHVYSTIAAPLVAQFCNGIDVDLISYGYVRAAMIHNTSLCTALSVNECGRRIYMWGCSCVCARVHARVCKVL